MVRQWQELFFKKRYAFTELKNPDFVKISEGYGIASQCIKDRTQLEQALNNMLDAKTSYLLEIRVENQENVFPMIPTGCGVDKVRLE
jgi:acetolactate synthase-1/2/3 large subunit